MRHSDPANYSNQTASKSANSQRYGKDFQHSLVTSSSSVEKSGSGNGQNPNDASTEPVSLLATGERVLMQTAKAIVQNPAKEQPVEARALFDSGSQRSYITENLARRLELSPIDEETLTLGTFGTKDITKFSSQLVDLEVRTTQKKSIRIRLNTTPCITHDLKRESLPSSIDRAQFNSVRLADDYFSEESEYSIDLLIGNDYYLKFMLQERRLVREGLYLINTRLGWMLTGRVESTGSNSPGLADLTFALTNGAVVESRALCLSERDSFLLKGSVERGEVKRAPVLTVKTTYCAIVQESSLAEETIETDQSPEIVRISPVETPPIPMF